MARHSKAQMHLCKCHIRLQQLCTSEKKRLRQQLDDLLELLNHISSIVSHRNTLVKYHWWLTHETTRWKKALGCNSAGLTASGNVINPHQVLFRRGWRWDSNSVNGNWNVSKCWAPVSSGSTVSWWVARFVWISGHKHQPLFEGAEFACKIATLLCSGLF